MNRAATRLSKAMITIQKKKAEDMHCPLILLRELISKLHLEMSIIPAPRIGLTVGDD